MYIDSVVSAPASAAEFQPRATDARPAADTLRAVDAARSAEAARFAAATKASEPAPTAALVRAAAAQIDAYLRSNGRSLEFRVDQDSHRVVVSVHDAATGEVIRQIPDEEVLRTARVLSEALAESSVVLDTKA